MKIFFSIVTYKRIQYETHCITFRFGGRFFALNNCYDKRFRKLGRVIAHEIGMGSRLHEGVYTMLGGPNFGKIKMLHMMHFS